MSEAAPTHTPPRKTRVLITTEELDHGGVEEVILTYAAHLDKSRYELTVACVRPGKVSAEIARIPGVRVVEITSPGKLRRMRAFIALARALRPDIVHNHACWYGHLSGWLSGARNVETVHNTYFWYSPKSRWHYGLDMLLSDRIIAVSDAVRRFTISEFPLMRPEKFLVIHNGIDAARFRDVEGGAALRAALGITREATVVGFVGRLTEQKGVGYLIDAARELSETHRDAHFVIVGEGELSAELRERARGLGQVIFAGFQREIPLYLSMFDLFVLPSLWEGLPVSILEAMAASKPVVATAVGGTPEIVIDGETGFIVPPKDPRALAERLGRLLSDAALRAAMGRAGRARVEAHFSAAGMVRTTEALYERLLGRR